MAVGTCIYYALALVLLVVWFILRRAAFRTSIGWGIFVLLVPLGGLVFAIKHWSEVGKTYLLYVGISVAQIVMVFTVPSVLAIYIHRNPAFATLAQMVNPNALAAARNDGAPPPADPQKATAAKPTPREVRDLAEHETPLPAAKPHADPYALQRAAYTKHARELTALYGQLNAERPKLKPGSPAMAAFNARAAKYQQGLQTLADEKSRLDALDHAANLNVDAANALASLQASAAGGDYEAFAGTLKKALAEDRGTPSFGGIVALARATVPQATPDRIAAGLQAHAARSAQAEFDKTTRQVQAIVNQTPLVVPKPSANAEVYHYGYHPGAEKPNYAAADNLLGKREVWKGDFAYLEDVPGVYYRSAECEFNPQTKFFYLNRSLPKKKLSDAEYQELTRLYHLLGQQEKSVADATPPPGAVERVSADLAALKAQLDGYAKN